MAESLTYIYNLCIEKSYIPQHFKLAAVTPVFKGGDANNVNDYRPISLISVLSKVLEKHIFKHMTGCLDNHNLIYDYQSGFRKNHSCQALLTYLTERWQDAINNDRLNGVILVDLCKAFDTIDHSIFLKKLSIYNFHPMLIRLLSSFLSNRLQVVKYQSMQSRLYPIGKGVPQGSVLGPLFFNIYVNDLPLLLPEGQCVMFADDTSATDSDPDIFSLENRLQGHLITLQNWCESNRMAINATKTKVMLISTRQKIAASPKRSLDLHFNNMPIECVSSHKLLGVVIDQSLTWKEHTSHLVKKISRNVFLLSKIKHFLDESSRKMFYLANIQSHFSYCSVVWSRGPSTTYKQLEGLHRRALRLVFGLGYRDPINYISEAILPARQYFFYLDLVFVYRILHGKSPLYLRPLLQIKHSVYFSRLVYQIVLGFPRTELFRNSFTYAAGQGWNYLPTSIKLLPFQAFKKHLQTLLLSRLPQI